MKIVYNKGELERLKRMTKEQLELSLFFLKAAMVAKVVAAVLDKKARKGKKVKKK